MTLGLSAVAATLEPQDDISGTNYGRVRDVLREQIVNGVLSPGTRLKVQDLAAQFGLSGNPVREALQQLQGEGFVIILPNRGATVRRIDATLLHNIYQVREALEGYLTGRAALVACPRDVEELASINQRMFAARMAGERQAQRMLNTAFHRRVFALAGNAEATAMLDRHRSLTRSIRNRCGFSPTRPEEVHREHLDIIDAVARADATAAELRARRHVVHSASDLLLRFAEQADRAPAPGA